MSTFVILEDEKQLQMYMAAILQKGGFSSIIFAKGEECLDYFNAIKDKNNLPLAMFIDLMLSGIDGLSVIQKIRTSALGLEVPIFIISSISDQQVVLQGKRLNVTGYLVKPFKPQDFLNLLKKHQIIP